MTIFLILIFLVMGSADAATLQITFPDSTNMNTSASTLDWNPLATRIFKLPKIVKLDNSNVERVDYSSVCPNPEGLDDFNNETTLNTNANNGVFCYRDFNLSGTLTISGTNIPRIYVLRDATLGGSINISGGNGANSDQKANPEPQGGTAGVGGGAGGTNNNGSTFNPANTLAGGRRGAYSKSPDSGGGGGAAHASNGTTGGGDAGFFGAGGSLYGSFNISDFLSNGGGSGGGCGSDYHGLQQYFGAGGGGGGGAVLFSVRHDLVLNNTTVLAYGGKGGDYSGSGFDISGSGGGGSGGFVLLQAMGSITNSGLCNTNISEGKAGASQTNSQDGGPGSPGRFRLDLLDASSFSSFNSSYNTTATRKNNNIYYCPGESSTGETTACNHNTGYFLTTNPISLGNTNLNITDITYDGDGNGGSIGLELSLGNDNTFAAYSNTNSVLTGDHAYCRIRASFTPGTDPTQSPYLNSITLTYEAVVQDQNTNANTNANTNTNTNTNTTPTTDDNTNQDVPYKFNITGCGTMMTPPSLRRGSGLYAIPAFMFTLLLLLGAWLMARKISDRGFLSQP